MHVSDSDLARRCCRLLGASLLLLSSDGDEARRARRSREHRAGRLAAGVRRDAAAVEPLRRRRRRSSSSSSATPGFRRSASSYSVGVDGISLLLLVLTGFLTPLALLGSWESVHKKTQGVLHLRAAARERDDRRLRLARPVPVLRVLGRDADPDVFPDRHLGLRPPHLRGGQVHPLHDGRQRADAAGDPRPGLPALRRDRQPTASTC